MTDPLRRLRLAATPSATSAAGRAAMVSPIAVGEWHHATVEPLCNRVSAALGLRPLSVGLAIACVLTTVLLANEALLGRLRDALLGAHDLHIAIVESLLVGYLVAARIAAMDAARATLDGLRDALDLSEVQRTRVRDEMGRYLRLRFDAAGIAGMLLAVMAPMVIFDSTAHPWNWTYWSTEFAWRRCLALLVGWQFGTYVLVTVREADRVSGLAHHLKTIDLFDSDALAPFSRFGLQTAFGAVGLLSVISLMLAERGFGDVVAGLAAVAALAAAAGLLHPLRGLRARIAEEKKRELAWCRDALHRARDALTQQPPVGLEAGRLSELLAYRGLVESVNEWPVDTPTALRTCACVLLPLGSWMGGALSSPLADRIVAIVVG